MLDKANTGDGLITALSLLEVKKVVGSLQNFSPYPMLEFNLSAQNPTQMIAESSFQQKITEVNAKYSKKGRLIIRPSGTEPFVRIAFECFSSKPDAIFEDIKNTFMS